MTESFSERLAFARRHRGLSQSQLARASGLVNDQAVSRYECGRQMPKTEAVVGLARALRVSVDWLIAGRGRGPTVTP
jgi:transcriptional regulator with XRE-family HTH domain